MNELREFADSRCLSSRVAEAVDAMHCDLRDDAPHRVGVAWVREYEALIERLDALIAVRQFERADASAVWASGAFLQLIIHPSP